MKYKYQYGLKSPVDDAAVERAFHVKDDVLFFQQAEDIQAFKLLVGNGGDAGVELLAGQLVHHLDTVFVLHDGRVGPGVVDGDVEVVFLQCLVDVDDLGVAHVGAVLLEGETKDEDVALQNLNAFLQHQLDGLGGNVFTHAVVHSTPGKDNLGIVTITLGALGQIIRVDTDTMATHQSRTERQEVPLGACGFQHVEGVDAHLVENLRKLVHEGDVDVALRVLNHLGSLSNLHGRGEMGAGGNDAAVDFIDISANLRRGSRSHFLDMLHGVEFVARVDAFGAVAAVEVDVHLR